MARYGGRYFWAEGRRWSSEDSYARWAGARDILAPPSTAEELAEAEALVADGYFQTSGKYRGVAKVDATEGLVFSGKRTLTLRQFKAFKAAGGTSWVAAMQNQRREDT